MEARVEEKQEKHIRKLIRKDPKIWLLLTLDLKLISKVKDSVGKKFQGIALREKKSSHLLPLQSLEPEDSSKNPSKNLEML